MKQKWKEKRRRKKSDEEMQLKKRILAKFQLITPEIRVNISDAYQRYVKVLEDIKKLKEEFPRIQRRTKVLSVYDKKLLEYLTIYEEFDTEVTRKHTTEE